MLVRGSDVRNGTIVMVVQKKWEGRGDMDVDSAAHKNTNLLFVEVMGEPRKTTRFKTIGFMKPIVVSKLFVVPTNFFLDAKELPSTDRGFIFGRGRAEGIIEDASFNE